MDEVRHDRYKAILQRFREANVQHAAVLCAQLEQVEIVSEDIDEDQTGGFVHLAVPDGVPRLPPLSESPINAGYYDKDEMFIDIMLHEKKGAIALLEWYRISGPPLEWPPDDASLVHIGSGFF